MSSQRDYGRIAEGNRPFIIARSALDLAYKDEERRARQHVDEGGDLLDLINQGVSHPLQESAFTVMRTSQPEAEQSIGDWFRLKAVLAMGPNQSWADYVFSAGKNAHPQPKRLLKQSTYTACSALLSEALYLSDHESNTRRRRELIGFMSEIGVLALLSRSSSTQTGARFASAVADNMYKTDLLHHSYSNWRPVRTSIQVKTKRHTEADATPDPDVPAPTKGRTKMPSHVRVIFANDYLGGGPGNRAGFWQIVRDAKGKLSEIEKRELAERSQSLQQDLRRAT